MVKKWRERSPTVYYFLLAIIISSIISGIIYWAGLGFSFIWWFFSFLFTYVIILNIKSGRQEIAK